MAATARVTLTLGAILTQMDMAGSILMDLELMAHTAILMDPELMTHTAILLDPELMAHTAILLPCMEHLQVMELSHSSHTFQTRKKAALMLEVSLRT